MPRFSRSVSHPLLSGAREINALSEHGNWLILSAYDKLLAHDLRTFYANGNIILRYLNPHEAALTAYTSENALLTASLGFCTGIKAALQKLEETRPALIFMDWSLNGGSAYELLQQIQNAPGYDPYVISTPAFRKIISRCRNFYFSEKGAPLCIPLSWQACCELLDEHHVDYYIAKSRSHLVVKDYIAAFEKPFIRLKCFARKFEVVRENISDFEAWLMQHDLPGIPTKE